MYLLAELNGVVNIAYGILVYNTAYKEQDSNVINFLNRCIDIDPHLNSDKCKINCKPLPCFGVKIMAESLKPDPTEVTVHTRLAYTK